MNTKIMKLGLDIDGTILAYPEFFAILSNSVKKAGGMVYIVTSRTPCEEIEEMTAEQLDSLGISYDEICFTPDYNDVLSICPHKELTWDQQREWCKVKFCLEKGFDIVFDEVYLTPNPGVTCPFVLMMI